MKYSRPRHQLVHENIVKLLSMAKQVEDQHWSTWMKCVASSLYLEHKLKSDFDIVTGPSKKSILANLELLSDVGVNDWTKQDAYEWCKKTYHVNHPLRFSVETLDSIESVRKFLKQKNKGLNDLLVLKYKYKWEVAK